MGNPTQEREVFKGFLVALPMFAGSTVQDWHQPEDDPPDVHVDLSDGRKVAVELTSWLDESQIGHEKNVETLQASFQDAIRPEPPNDTAHILRVWLAPKRRVSIGDRAAFRSELLSLMNFIDENWGNIAGGDSPQSFFWNEFTKYPTLEKHLYSVDIHPRRSATLSTMRKGALHWLTFPARGGAYSPASMVDALVECVRAKTTKYLGKPFGASEFHLLVHYDKAMMYNTPVVGINVDYGDAVRSAAASIGSAVGAFDKIFVYVPVADGQQAFQLYP